jgi:uncharacterized protein (TIGR02145 family)
LPGGHRKHYNGYFGSAGTDGYWWSSSPNGSNAWSRNVFDYDDSVDRLANNTHYGYSVRCI